MKLLLIALVSVGAFAAVGLAADKPLAWPQFRGPNGSGVADGQKPPVEFGPDKNVKWKVPVPSGLSSPIVAGDKLVITAFDGGKLYTIAYNRADGKEAWRAEAPAKTDRGVPQDRGQPGRVHARDGRRADRVVLRLVRAVLLRPVGEGTLEVRDAAGGHCRETSAAGSRRSSRTASSSSSATRRRTRKSSRSTRPPGTLKWEKKRQSPASYCTPVVWDTPAGKQVVAAGHARMIGYDLKTGAEKWSVAGMPSGCCSSPVTADGTLFFAGWSPGGPDDKEIQMPTFDALLKDLDTDKDGALSREEAEKAFEGFFDNQDTNKDGKITRDEWDAILKFMSEGKNSAFALKAGGTGDVTKSHVLWKKTKGLPYIAVGDRVPRAVRDGEGRRDRHRLRREDGQGGVPGASAPRPASTTPRRWPRTGTSTSRPWTTAP